MCYLGRGIACAFGPTDQQVGGDIEDASCKAGSGTETEETDAITQSGKSKVTCKLLFLGPV